MEELKNTMLQEIPLTAKYILDNYDNNTAYKFFMDFDYYLILTGSCCDCYKDNTTVIMHTGINKDLCDECSAKEYLSTSK